MKQRKNVVIYSNIQEKFASTNLIYNLKNKRYKIKNRLHSTLFLLQTKTTDFN